MTQIVECDFVKIYMYSKFGPSLTNAQSNGLFMGWIGIFPSDQENNAIRKIWIDKRPSLPE
jgi:hypothetical protein